MWFIVAGVGTAPTSLVQRCFAQQLSPVLT